MNQDLYKIRSSQSHSRCPQAGVSIALASNIHVDQRLKSLLHQTMNDTVKPPIAEVDSQVSRDVQVEQARAPSGELSRVLKSRHMQMIAICTKHSDPCALV